MVGNFIRVLEHLIELNNFMSAMSIISSLNMACIQRLKRIWKVRWHCFPTSHFITFRARWPVNLTLRIESGGS